MEYASPVWHSRLTFSEATTLERLQACMARIILRVPWNTPKFVMLTTVAGMAIRDSAGVEQLHTCLFFTG